MKIKHLINDIYQVVSEDEKIVYFENSKEECMTYLLKDVKLKTWIKQELTKQQDNENSGRKSTGISR